MSRSQPEKPCINCGKLVSRHSEKEFKTCIFAVLGDAFDRWGMKVKSVSGISK